MLNKTTVAVRDVNKTYTLTRSGSEIGFKSRRTAKTISALTGISFSAQAGDSIGVLGRNGSGKSTLMNLIAGNETPSKGEILVSSRPSLLSVSAALLPHLSGVQNVKLGLLAKGVPLDTVIDIQDSVAEWADIGEAVHRPIKTYSSGMKARLKFSIATAVRPEILLVDEALATGDKAFTDKAKERMDSFLQQAGTVFIVSHSAATIQSHCSRAMWLHEGSLVADGPVEEVSKYYSDWAYRVSKDRQEAAQASIKEAHEHFGPKPFLFDSEIIAYLDGQ